MQYNDYKYQAYTKILEEELVPAMGCTEPIAIAYCAAIMKDTLGNIPEKIDVYVSGNILKNVKSVTVPNTGGMHGIDAACAVGVIAGDKNKKLEVISKVSNEQIIELRKYLDKKNIKVYHSDNESVLYIEIIGKYGNDYVKVIIQDAHTNVVLIEKNNQIVYHNDVKVESYEIKIDKSILSIKEIIEYINILKIEDIKKILDRQIKYNMDIATVGINNNFGANIGKTILKYSDPNDVLQVTKAYSAAGSDARMNGCDMPVVINSGSGNQGITASVPVIIYARMKNKDEESLYKALALSNLCTIHIKNSIGKLSAFCGVVIAGAGCSAGIAYLDSGKEEDIIHAIVNTLGIVSGMVCDGAKSSCAAKISSAVEAGFIGYYMFKDGNQFFSGDGFIKKGVENTIKAIGSIARVGMCETDKEIIHIMLDD